MTQDLDLIRLYKTALRIRRVESRIAERYSENMMRCPVHLSLGQEIPSAIFEQVIQSKDTAISTHRAHAHYLAMGGNLSKMIAEIYGKITGCSKGRGGSMHLIDLEKGFLGSSAIVGNSIPIGVGVAYAKYLNSDEGISFVFFGDGATEEGSFFESLNFAVIHKLPVVFIVENNFYSVYTSLELRQPSNRSIANFARAIGLRSESASDSEIFDTYAKLIELCHHARTGKGPSLIEISTYRYLEHCGPNDDDHLGYRPLEEIKKYKTVDHLEHLISRLDLSQDDINNIENAIKSEIDAAFEFAISSPFPTYSEAMAGVYAD